MSQSQSSESRFLHLLQPIRDLTKNWDVDIASQLEEYLGEIEQIAISFDGGATTMNFAEAALLIQGSACVYSKKVEYLCTLVYEVLDSLASRTKLCVAPSLDAEGKDKDTTFAAKVNDDDEFLCLDDIEEMKNIDKKDCDERKESGVHNLLKTPLALVPLEEAEKGDNPLVSRTGEILASRNDFNMNTCNLHASGTILLDLSHLSLLTMSMHGKPCSTPYPAGKEDGEDRMQAEDDVDDDGGGLPVQDTSMDDNDIGIDLPDPLAAGDEGKTACHASEPERELPKRSARTKQKPELPPKPIVDPWLPLDPHEANAIAQKCFKKARTCKIPTSLKLAEKSRKRKSACQSADPKETKPKVVIAEFCKTAFYSNESKYPTNTLKVPTLPEFEQLFWKELHRRQALQKQHSKQLIQQGRLDELAEQEVADGAEVPPDDDNDGDDDDDVGGFLIPEMIDLSAAREEAIASMSSENTYEDLVRKYVDGFLASAQQYAQTTELSRRVADWEQKILPQLLEEEKRKAFDIHKYGSEILERLQSESFRHKEWVLFRDVTAQKPDYEICRLLLASLQLANNRNVDIQSSPHFEHCVNTMSMRLLSISRHHEELAGYCAPSSQTATTSQSSHG